MSETHASEETVSQAAAVHAADRAALRGSRAGRRLDPRYDPPPDERNRGVGRKALQLCRQVHEALSAALAACNDQVLRELSVQSVEPAPNTARLLVTLRCDSAGSADVVVHLQGAAGLLRCEVAAAINRRKAPELAFRVVTGPRGPGLPVVTGPRGPGLPVHATP